MSLADNLAAKVRANTTANPGDSDAPATPPPAPVKRSKAKPADAEVTWAGPVARPAVTRKSLNVGMPVELNIHHRLALLKLAEGITAHDAAAAALDEWLTAKGIPRNA